MCELNSKLTPFGFKYIRSISIHLWFVFVCAGSCGTIRQAGFLVMLVRMCVCVCVRVQECLVILILAPSFAQNPEPAALPCSVAFYLLVSVFFSHSYACP